MRELKKTRLVPGIRRNHAFGRFSPSTNHHSTSQWKLWNGVPLASLFLPRRPAEEKKIAFPFQFDFGDFSSTSSTHLFPSILHVIFLFIRDFSPYEWLYRTEHFTWKRTIRVWERDEGAESVSIFFAFLRLNEAKTDVGLGIKQFDCSVMMLWLNHETSFRSYLCSWFLDVYRRRKGIDWCQRPMRSWQMIRLRNYGIWEDHLFFLPWKFCRESDFFIWTVQEKIQFLWQVVSEFGRVGV